MSDGPDFGREILVVLTRQAEAMDRVATALEALAKDKAAKSVPERVDFTPRHYDQGDSSPESGHGEGIPALRRPKSAANG